MTMDLERGTMRQWVMGRDGVKRWADTNEPVERTKMGLTDYAVQRDKFQAEEVTNGFDFPCGACIHRRGTDTDEPCRTCDHNMRSVPDDEVPNA